MLRIHVLAEKPRSGAAHEVCDRFNGILPKRLIDGGVIDDADQIAQPLTIIANACDAADSEAGRRCAAVFIPETVLIPKSPQMGRRL